MANSRRKCGFCKERFPTETMIIKGAQAFCSNDHWIENQVKNKDKLIAKGQKMQKTAKRKEEIEAEKAAKEERKRLKQRKEELRPLKWYEDKAQAVFNKFIRLRDKGLPCISCGKPDNGQHQRHASHYRSRGGCSFLRFDENNCHASCMQCNSHMSGNIINYTPALIEKVGIDEFNRIEAAPKSRKWTREELQGIESKYKDKCKELERCQ